MRSPGLPEVRSAFEFPRSVADMFEIPGWQIRPSENPLTTMDNPNKPVNHIAVKQTSFQFKGFMISPKEALCLTLILTVMEFKYSLFK